MHPFWFRRLALAVPAVALLALACSDSPSEPRDTLVVTAALGNAPEPRIFEATPTSPALVRCVSPVRLLVSGTGRSRFGETTIYRFRGVNRATPVDSTRLAPVLVQQAFAATAIVPNVDLIAVWTLDDSVPFSARFVIRHRVDGSNHDETLTVDSPCGPVPQGTGPQVSDVTVSAATPGLEPGDTAIVRFQASSTTGIWRTVVRITGPCTATVASTQALQASAQLEARVPLPASCARGAALQVSVTVVDAALREQSTSITGPALVDATPPSLQAGSLIDGDNFALDTLVRDVVAMDDVALAWVGWQWVGTGLRDSVAVRGTRAPLTLRIPIPAAVVGRPQLRVTVVDSAGNTTTAFTSAAGSVRVLPTLDRPVTSVTIPGALSDIRLDERRGHVLVLQGVARRLLVLDRTTLATVRSIALPDSAGQMDLSAGGDSVLLGFATPGTLGVVDLRPPTPVVTTMAMTGIDTVPARIPYQLVATSRGTVMVMTVNSGFSEGRLVETTLPGGATRVRRDVGVAPGFTLISRNRDASVVAFAKIGCLQRWTAATDAFDACRSLTGDDMVSFSADGQRAALSRLVLNATFGLVLTAEAPNGAFFPRTQLDADGRLLLISMQDRGIARSRTSDGVLVDRLAMPAHVIRPWSDGSAIVSATGYRETTTRVFVIDPR